MVFARQTPPARAQALAPQEKKMCLKKTIQYKDKPGASDHQAGIQTASNRNRGTNLNACQSGCLVELSMGA